MNKLRVFLWFLLVVAIVFIAGYVYFVIEISEAYGG